MKKRIMTTLLASAMLLSIAGCDSSTETTTTTTAAPAANGTTTPAAADDNADTPDTPDDTASDATDDADKHTVEYGDTSADTGKVLNIYCWNDEFQQRFNGYAADLVPADVTVNWVINTNEGGVYQQALDSALQAQSSAADDDKVDIFLIEADYALKYTGSPYAMNISDLGITSADLSDQYKYTQEIVTANGQLKGVTWQATPGLFAYRRSIATEVLGTDDPAEVQKAVADWDKFDETAAKMKEAGYYMLAGFDDSYRVFSNNVSRPWVVDGKLEIDPNIMNWVDQTMDYTEKGYNNKVKLWDPAWAAEQGPSGKSFGFFYSTWGINFTLLGNSLETAVADGGKEEVGNGIYGDYAVCEGPAPYYWGGTWICAATGTDNAVLVANVMKRLTCDSETQKQITIDTQDYTNTVVGMNSIANDPNYGSSFLGGQNHIALFAEAAPNIDCSNISAYDQLANENLQTCMHDYFNGEVTKEQALNNFYQMMKDTYPELTVPEA
ncbi:MAG: hypothetical protein NC084_04965 [Bacteroides sp.]|nr:carbohydrate ABC transporter substrate-binding protein [Eubacterium sp.]MCM1418451.1 carbohydrate ABC transporter substrate-binding protein [Roseburia sp.]MCM1462047.1 hypothetical protein [Bacteroides sp.]